MKKSFIYLSLALAMCTTTAIASNSTIETFRITKNYNSTPLSAAIMKGDLDTVKKFIEYGANVNEKSNGRTPLMIAARYNKVEIVKFLIESGADINQKDSRGLTALKHAELSNASEVVELLKSEIKK